MFETSAVVFLKPNLVHSLLTDSPLTTRASNRLIVVAESPDTSKSRALTELTGLETGAPLTNGLVSILSLTFCGITGLSDLILSVQHA